MEKVGLNYTPSLLSVTVIGSRNLTSTRNVKRLTGGQPEIWLVRGRYELFLGQPQHLKDAFCYLDKVLHEIRFAVLNMLAIFHLESETMLIATVGISGAQ